MPGDKHVFGIFTEVQQKTTRAKLADIEIKQMSGSQMIGGRSWYRRY
jgi:hypothetical protein